MQAYKYKALSPDGVQVKGVIEAYDRYEAIQKIKIDCPIVTELEEVRNAKANSLLNAEIGGKIKAKDIAIMSSQFYIVLRAGMSIGRAVEMIARQTENNRLKKILEKVAADVQSGRSLSQSLEDEGGDEIPRTFIETIRAGEESGNLDVSFERSKGYFENSNKLQKKVKEAMMQPAFTMVVAVVVVIFLMAKVVPQFIASFADLGADLPLMTKMLIAISDFFGKWWLLMLAVILIAVILFRAYSLTEQGKQRLARFSLTNKLLGPMMQMNAAAEFASTMSTMLGSGLTILNAVRVTGNAMGNVYAGKQTAGMEERLMTGAPLGVCMRDLDFYPDILREMTAIGEETGSLEETMKTMAEYYSVEAEYATTKFVNALQPILLCATAVVAGFIVIAMYGTMFSLYAAM